MVQATSPQDLATFVDSFRIELIKPYIRRWVRHCSRFRGYYTFFHVQNNSRVHSPVWGKGNPLLPVEIYYHIRKFDPRSGVKRVIFGHVCKNGHVQEDIIPGVYTIILTPLVYNIKSNILPFKIFLNDLEKSY